MHISTENLTNTEAERMLIACALTWPDFREEILLSVSHADFLTPTFRDIFNELEKMKKENLEGDIFMIAHRLKEKNITLEYLENLMSYFNHDIIISEWITIVKQFAAARISINQVQAYAKTIADNPQNIEKERDKLVKQTMDLPIAQKINSHTIGEIINNWENGLTFKEVREKRIREGFTKPQIDISWGFRILDRQTNGIQKGHLIIVGARPAVGKTTFSLNICANLMTQTREVPALFISYEMTKHAITTKLLSIHSRISSKNIEEGRLDTRTKEEVDFSEEKLSKKPLIILDKSLTINEIITHCKEMVRLHKIEVVVIDYLALIKNNIRFDKEVDRISYLSRELKCLAKDNNLAVICLSQLSRSSEKENRRPTKADLRDSGQIEADADLVLLLHSVDNGLEVIVDKNRFGPTSILQYHFDKACGYISEK